MKKIILLIIISISVIMTGCSDDDDKDKDTGKGNVQRAIDAITDKISVKSLTITGELTDKDWAVLKSVREQLPAVEDITLSDVSTIKRDVFTFKNGIVWNTNKWLKSFSAPKAIKIEDAAFFYCENLSNFDAPAVEIIGANAFQVCENITSFNFPKTKEIGVECFVACEKLKSIVLPELIELNDRAFQGCKFLISGSFPKVLKIKNNPFQGCDSLIELKFSATTEIEVSDLSFELLETKNVSIDLAGVEASQAIGNIWKNFQWKNITNSGKPLPEPDFGVANFGCTMEFVSEHETKKSVAGGGSNRLIYANRSNDWYIYDFDENKKLISGTWDCSIQFGGTPTDLVFTPINTFVSELNELKEKFGEPDYTSEDVFAFDMNNKEMKPGFAWYEAQMVMNGSKKITYMFSNSTTEVESELSLYTRTGKTQVWGFTIKTTYSQK